MNNTVIFEDAQRIIERVDLTELGGKKILVTGATGLIGTYFIYSMVQNAKNGNVPEKLCVVHLHDLPQYLDIVRQYAWIELLKGDLCDNNFIENFERFDYILHFAGYGQPAKFSIDQVKTIKLNTSLTIELAGKLKEHGKFLFASSSGIYNGLNKGLFTEQDIGTTNTLHPRACYIEGKRCGEAIINGYRARGVNAKSARISYTYGPGVRKSDERALYSFIKKGINGKITLLDDGSAERIYCYISDVVELLWKILLFGEKPIYNVGGVEKTSILQVAREVGNLLGVPVELPEHSETISGNALLERLDMSNTLSEFPMDFIGIKEGMKKTVNWYCENYK